MPKFSRTNERITENAMNSIGRVRETATAFFEHMTEIQRKYDAAKMEKDRQFFTELAKVFSK